MNYVISDVKSRRKQTYVNMDPKTGDPEKIAAVNARMLTMPQYHVLARRVIGKWAPASIRSSMLNSDDAIDFVAHLIMIGDWDYDETKSNIKTHRGNCGKRAIQNYIKTLSRQTEQRPKYYLDVGIDDESNAYDYVEDQKSPQPFDRMETSEEREDIKKNLSMLLGNLNKTQQACVVMHHMQDMSHVEIAEELGITREGVRRAILDAMKTMRAILGVKPKKV